MFISIRVPFILKPEFDIRYAINCNFVMIKNQIVIYIYLNMTSKLII